MSKARIGSQLITDVRSLNKQLVKRAYELQQEEIPAVPACFAAATFKATSDAYNSLEHWANLRKHEILPAASQAFPTPRPSAHGDTVPKVCPLCKQQVN